MVRSDGMACVVLEVINNTKDMIASNVLIFLAEPGFDDWL